MLEQRPPLNDVLVIDTPPIDVPLLGVLRAGELLRVLRSVIKGDLSARMSLEHTGVAGEIAGAMNDVMDLEQGLLDELERISTAVGKDGRLHERMTLRNSRGAWQSKVDAVNHLITDLVQPTAEVGHVIGAFASGDLSRTMALEVDDRPLRGEFLRIARVVNGMVEQLGSFASEVTRVDEGDEGQEGEGASAHQGARVRDARGRDRRS